jgi:endonuclease/exonuclease/phosphatase family metal-dependent hydrolase
MKYHYLRPRKHSELFIADKTDRNAVIDNLIKLRAYLSEKLPEKKLSGNLLLATWNLREFGNTKYGGRMVESLYYIAEIISRFDLVAIQEVRGDLTEFDKILSILGEDYAVYTSIVTSGRSGNNERQAFVYDRRTVRFEDIAGQLVLPGTKTGPSEQFARAPYVIRFQAGWIKFDVATVHIYFGKDTKSSPQYKRRVKEIKQLVDYFSNQYEKDNGKNINNMFLLGDFNIEDTKSDTYKAATSARFAVPDSILLGELPGTNRKKDKMYDQILYKSNFDDIIFGKAGVLDVYEGVFQDLSEYASRIAKHDTGKEITSKNFNDFVTYQISDHLPLWIEMKTDRADDYLKFLKKQV